MEKEHVAARTGETIRNSGLVVVALAALWLMLRIPIGEVTVFHAALLGGEVAAVGEGLRMVTSKQKP